jgi:hypothetical protein
MGLVLASYGCVFDNGELSLEGKSSELLVNDNVRMKRHVNFSKDLFYLKRRKPLPASFLRLPFRLII